jgi:hypothetical protein
MVNIRLGLLCGSDTAALECSIKLQRDGALGLLVLAHPRVSVLHYCGWGEFSDGADEDYTTVTDFFMERLVTALAANAAGPSSY